MINYYKRFLKDATSYLAPLYELIPSNSSKNKELAWTEETVRCFEKSKTELATASQLAYPNPDAELSIATDASGTAVGALLQQTYNNITSPIAFFSKKLDPTQRRYSVFGRELLGIFLAIKHFRTFITGQPFQVYTDHKPILGAINNSRPRDISREIRQLNYISQFSPEIIHYERQFIW